MDESMFTSQFQSVIYQLMFRLLEGYGKQSKVTTTAQSSSLPTSQSAEGLQGSFAQIIKDVSARYNVDPYLVQSVVKAESGFNPNAESSAGALGLMQLMPSTAAWLGVTDPLNPEQNIDGGVRFLSQLLDRYNGNVSLALAAYNAGPGAVDKYGGIPPYEETQTYVNRVLNTYKQSLNEWSV